MLWVLFGGLAFSVGCLFVLVFVLSVLPVLIVTMILNSNAVFLNGCKFSQLSRKAKLEVYLEFFPAVAV